MARMYPDRILDEATPRSERMVFEALAGLDDDWMVFHSVAWQGLRGRRQNDGEADFVLAHPKSGCSCSSRSRAAASPSSTGNGSTTRPLRRGPRHQPVRPGPWTPSTCSVNTWPSGCLGSAAKVHMGHVVVFPDVEITGDLSAEAQREVILDRYDLQDIERSVNRVAGHWNDSTHLRSGAVRRPPASAGPDPQGSTTAPPRGRGPGRGSHRADRQQVRALGFLRRQRRALITGGAGTGKTVLAAERVRQLAGEGAQVFCSCASTLPLERS